MVYLSDQKKNVIVFSIAMFFTLLLVFGLLLIYLTRKQAPANIADYPLPTSTKEPSEINSFADCVEAGYFVMYTDPPQCAAPDGRVFQLN